MIDAELLAKKLAFVETCVSDLQRLAQPERIDSDLREPVAAVADWQVNTADSPCKPAAAC